MRVLGWIVLAAFAITALRATVWLISLALIAGFFVALIRAPARSLAALLSTVILNAFAAHPAYGLTLYALLLGSSFFLRNKKEIELRLPISNPLP